MTRSSNVALLLSTIAITAVFVGGAPQAHAQLSNKQQGCVNALNKSGGKVASTQGKANSGCVKDAGNSKLDQPTTDLCLTADPKQKIAKAESKTSDALTKKCEEPFPTFAYTTPTVINDAATSEEIALVQAIFGNPVHAAILTDNDGKKCQSSVAKAYEKLAATRVKTFNSCKKDGLKAGTITNATQLQSCVGSDPKNKVSGTVTKLGDTVVKACENVALATAFPGCSAEAGSNAALSACVARNVECRMCQYINAADGLDTPCDEHDDGNVNQTCRQCGNGAAEAPEPCDTAGDSLTCDFDCTVPACGDGHTNIPFGETCDDSGESATCDDDCSAPSCGDGNLNEASGEICDDGNVTDGDGCDSNCTVTACGNGITTAPEACDDGNLSNNDSCLNSCALATCGDTFTCNSVGCTSGPSGGLEQCDDANLTDTDACRNDCAAATCGDGVLCNQVGCTTGPSSGIEQCDDGGSNSDVTPDACRTTCGPASCGDSVIDAGESCDDGGNSLTCDSNCTPAACGDGFVNAAANETCDTSGESVSCDANCTAAVCGDGTINATAGELCDDSNAISGDGCSSTCQDGPGSGEQAAACPDLGELVLFSKLSNQVCANNGDCTLPRTCDPTLLRCTTVAELDSGWNGAGHDSDINDQVTARASLLCEGPASPGCGECEVTGIHPSAGNCRCSNDVLIKCDEPFVVDADDCGAGTCNCFFGAPFGLAAQGTPVCVSNRFAQDITGTANPDLGSGSITATLRAQVFLGHSTDLPCPVCGGKCSNDNSGCIYDDHCDGGATCVQDTPGDGIRDGVCVRDPDFYTGDGVACDIDGENANFPAIIGDTTPGQGGAGYSIDCQPDVGKNVSNQGLSIRLAQTTGLSSLSAGLDCDAGGVGTDLCPCLVCSGDQTAPCSSNAECAALGGSCAGAPSGGGVNCNSNTDCNSANVGPCLTGIDVCSKKTTVSCGSNADCLGQSVGPCNLQTCTSDGTGSAPQPNFCVDDICTDQGGGEGECMAGPAFSYCDALVKADGAGINSCNNNGDCSGGYGLCTVLDQADCYLDPIVATGVADPEFPVAGAAFCIPPTSNTGVNDSAGLPGPGRVVSQGAARTFCASDNNVEYTPGGTPACP
ncbi:MAG: DUF4215 domain-containing protein [Candidatus Binatia bacterium]